MLLVHSLSLKENRITIHHRYDGGGCNFNASTISTGQAFLIEFICSFILTYVDSVQCRINYYAELFPSIYADLLLSE